MITLYSINQSKHIYFAPYIAYELYHFPEWKKFQKSRREYTVIIRRWSNLWDCFSCIFTARGSGDSIVFSRVFLFSVTTISHEPLHLGWCNLAWTYVMAQLRVCEILVVIGIGVRIQDRISGFFTIARYGKNVCLHDNSWTAALNLMKFSTNNLPRQPLEFYSISRSYVKGQGHMGFMRFSFCMILAGST